MCSYNIDVCYVERGLGHAQAGVLCNDCIRRELVPVRDVPPGGPDPRQEGWQEFDKRHHVLLECFLAHTVVH